MRILALCSLIAPALLALGTPAGAEKGPPWCAAYRNGGTNCGFYTYQQCMETVAGNGGFCNRNYIDGPPDKPAARKEREAEPKAKRKEKEEVKERVAPKPVAPPAAAQPAPVIVQPPPVVVQPPAAASQQANSFGAARALILSGKYEAGIAAM